MKVYINEFQKLLSEKRESYRIDLHIHSRYSADGENSPQEIIDRAVMNKISIISITDHDDFQSVIDLYDHKVDTKGVVVIPGIEFSVYNKEYGNMFHVLQYGLNRNDEKINALVEYNRKANENRYRRQVELMNKNEICMQIMGNDMRSFEAAICNYKGSCIPDYIDIARVLYHFMLEQGMNLEDVLLQYQKIVYMDSNSTRREINLANVNAIRKRIKSGPYDPARILMKILANRNSEDSFFEESEPMGNISVSDYGQITMDQIDSKYVTVLAHPVYASYLKLNSSIKKRFHMIERNCANKRLDSKELLKIKKELNDVPVTIGSDYHYHAQNYYTLHPNFFEISYEELKQIYEVLERKENEHEG